MLGACEYYCAADDLCEWNREFYLLSILQSVIRQEEQAKAMQTHRVFSIADQTLPYFRQGLNEQSCKSVAEIIHRLTETDAVSLTDTEKILAHVGDGTDHHIPSKSLITGLSKQVLISGKIMKAHSKMKSIVQSPTARLKQP